jgi:Ca-activated chloride channel family protein
MMQRIKIFPRHKRRNLPLVVTVLLLVFCFHSLSGQAESAPAPATTRGWLGWWLTPDQQGQKLFDQGEFARAAEVFHDPGRRGVAYFRAGEFENAAVIFGRIPTAQAAYNRGNALIMLGRYEEAIESYEQALKLKPAWVEAEQNRDLAAARKEMLAPPETDDGGTGGQLEADEIVFDESGRVNRSDQEQEVQEGGPMSDEEMRAIWLRRVQNDPADFLRTRFAYQLYRDEQSEQGDD